MHRWTSCRGNALPHSTEVKEKFFKQYYGEHYTMAFFNQDTMICDMDRLCTSLCDNSKGLSHMFGWGGSTSSSIPQAGAKERRGYSSPRG